jgi:hypothetical protein
VLLDGGDSRGVLGRVGEHPDLVHHGGQGRGGVREDGVRELEDALRDVV